VQALTLQLLHTMASRSALARKCMALGRATDKLLVLLQGPSEPPHKQAVLKLLEAQSSSPGGQQAWHTPLSF
jgi:hypothetical protein